MKNMKVKFKIGILLVFSVVMLNIVGVTGFITMDKMAQKQQRRIMKTCCLFLTWDKCVQTIGPLKLFSWSA